MKRAEKNLNHILERYLARYGAPPQDDVAGAQEKVWHRLKQDPAQTWPRRSSNSSARASQRFPLVAVAAAVVVLLLSAAMLRSILWTSTVYAVVDIADAPMVRVASGKALTIQVGDRLQASDVLRSTGGGVVLSLSGGSKIEMRAESELSLEPVTDGVRIRLNRGGVIVNASDHRPEQLYVQTPDVTASVVGTVSLVNAEETGSRVAVILGEAQVKAGEVLKTLMSGEQVSTSRVLETQRVTDGISWSRNLAPYLALLQQAAPANIAAPPPGDLEAFEVVSIRPAAPPRQQQAGGRGGPSNAPSVGETPFGQCAGQMTSRVDVTPGRFVATNVNVIALIGLAYGVGCPIREVLSGGPQWLRTERFDIQSTMPTGTPVYTRRQLREGHAPALQRMLQTMLADRFKLGLRQEKKETSGYHLVVVKEGMFKETEMGPDGRPVPRPDDTYRPVSTLAVRGASMAGYAGILQSLMARPVIDKTGLTGLYDLKIEIPEVAVVPEPGQPTVEITDFIPEKIQQQLGLKLEPVRTSIDIFTIERIEKPTEN
jgi:uncharacterized protein (TIGR03435 family)